jgi:hypothetical protein
VGERGRCSAAEGGQTKQKITCPQMRIAVIIGKRGVTINAIQFVSGAKVQVAQQQPGSAFTDVNITGATPALKKRERERGAHTGGGHALAFKQPTWPYDMESGPGGLTREVETPFPSNSPHGHMIWRVDLVGSHGRWKRPFLQTAHMAI